MSHRPRDAWVISKTSLGIKTGGVDPCTVARDCLSKAQADADARWTAACKARRQGANCPLPEAQADAFDRAESAARNACLIGH